MQPDPHALAHLLRSTGRTSVEIANLLRERGHRISSSTVTSWMKVPGATTEPTRPRWYLLTPLADALNIPRATLYAACAGEAPTEPLFALSPSDAAMCGGKGPDFCRKGASCRKHNGCVYFGGASR